jgi:uncharacterized protein YndB with AHSA1/START domain
MDYGYSTSIEIDAPARDVWSFLTDPSLQREWVPGLISVDTIEGNPGEVGYQSRSISMINGAASIEESSVRAVETNRLLESEQRSKDIIVVVRRTLSERDGTTTVTTQYLVHGLSWFRRAWSMVLEPFARMNSRVFNERLKAKVEDPSVELTRPPVLPGTQWIARIFLVALPLVAVATSYVLEKAGEGHPVVKAIGNVSNAMFVIVVVGMLLSMLRTLRRRPVLTADSDPPREVLEQWTAADAKAAKNRRAVLKIALILAAIVGAVALFRVLYVTPQESCEKSGGQWVGDLRLPSLPDSLDGCLNN